MIGLTRGRVLAAASLLPLMLPFVAAGDEPGATLDAAADHRFPASAVVLDVTKPPYGAKGDGRTDDAAALQKAFDDAMGRHVIVFLPNGEYLVSAPLLWKNKNADGKTAYGFNWLQGQNPLKTVIRLKDGVFTDRAKPQAILWCGGFGSADWFHNYIQDVTFDVGAGNPGAIGLQFYSNNTGAVRDVAVVSRDGAGLVGMDFSHRDMNGPLLVRNVVVRGFEVGIKTGAVVNSQTFENIQLSGQTKFGFVNAGQSIAIRRLRSENAVPALRAESFAALLDSDLVGVGGAAERPAVELATDLFYARDVATTGYKTVVVDKDGKTPIDGPTVAEFIAGKATSPFDGPAKSLRLPVEETPTVPWDDPAEWAVVDKFGADPTGGKDSSTAAQKAIDSGATTVFFPGFYSFEKPVKIRGKVRRVLGCGAWIDYLAKSKPDFIVAGGSADVVVIEHFAPINGGLRIETDRTVVLRSVETRIDHQGKGKLFLEDVATGEVKLKPGHRLWARQLNVENEGTHVSNDGGSLWVLGYKTERGGTLLHAKQKARSELFGNFSYTTTAGKLAPMFVTDGEASTFAFFNEVCYSGDPFAVLIKETRKKIVKEIKAGEGTTTPYVGVPGTPLKPSK
ncbi:MAG: glycosyl hydrolase family 28-related protein [Planctomycetia bacterium]